MRMALEFELMKAFALGMISEMSFALMIVSELPCHLTSLTDSMTVSVKKIDCQKTLKLWSGYPWTINSNFESALVSVSISSSGR